MDLGEKFVIKSNSLEPKQGKILISEPLMNDFHFGRAVILLIDHVESEGSFGIIISYICPLMYMNNPLCKKKPVITCSNKLRTYTSARFYTEGEILDIITGKEGKA